MIGQVLEFLRQQLSDELTPPNAGQEPRLVFVCSELGSLRFASGVVTMLLLNVEEERTLRAPDRFVQRTADGTRRSFPDIRLELMLLFVAADFTKYNEAWGQLSRLISHFQLHPVYDRQSMPNLPKSIEKLLFELVTLDFAAQNEIWNALRVSHQPSVLYKTSMVVVRDTQAYVPASASVHEIDMRVEEIS